MTIPEWAAVLALPAGGLTWLAVNHQAIYAKIAIALIAAIFLYLAFLIGLGKGVDLAVGAVAPLVSDQAAAQKAVSAAFGVSRVDGLWVPMGCAFYIIFLRLLGLSLPPKGH